MSSSVDERVVEMRFDNAQFEKGARQTLNTLDNLKEGLKFSNAIGGIGILQNAIDHIQIRGIADGVDNISNRFSALGVVGMEVVRRVTDAAIDGVTRVATAIPAQIKSGGWNRALNIENAKFQLEGLKVAWKDVNNDLQYAVNGTAYGLDSAAKAAAQLSASGIKAGNSLLTTATDVDKFAEGIGKADAKAQSASGQLDDMAIALRSISGVAAMTNSSYDDIANVYIRVAGQGRVMATDLNSLAARGLNAAAELGKALGVTESEVRDMVSKGQIDFKTFSDAMYDAFADHAVEANKTFQGALSNTKAALSKIGADVADDLLPAMTEVLNNVRLVFNSIRTYITPVTDSLGKLIIALGDVIGKTFGGIADDIKKASTAAETPMTKMAGFIDNLTSKVQAFADMLPGHVDDKVKNTTETVQQVTETVQETTDAIDDLAAAVMRGDYANGAERMEALGDSYAEVMNRVNELMGSSKRYEVQADQTTEAVEVQTVAVEEQTEAVKKSTAEVKKSAAVNVLKGIGNIGKTLAFVFKTFGEAVADAAKGINKISLYNASEAFEKFTGVIVNNEKAVKAARDTIFNVVHGFANIVSAIVQVGRAIGIAIGNTISAMGGFDFAGVSKGFRNFTEALILSEDGVQGLAKVLTVLLSPLRIVLPVISLIGEALYAVATAAAKAVSGIIDFVGRANGIDRVGKATGSAKDNIVGFFNAFKQSKPVKAMGDALGKAKESAIAFAEAVSKNENFKAFIKSVKELGKALSEKFVNALGVVANKIAGLNSSAVKGGASTIDKLAAAFGAITGKIAKLNGALTDLVKGRTSIVDFFKFIGKSISDFFTSIDWGGLIGKIDFTGILGAIANKFSQAAGVFNWGEALNPSVQKAKGEYTNQIRGALNSADADLKMESVGGGNSETNKVNRGAFGITGALNGMSKSIKNIDISNPAEVIAEKLKKFLHTVATALTDKDVTTILKSAAGWSALFTLIRTQWKFGDFMDSIGSVAVSASDVLDQVAIKLGKKPPKSKFRQFTDALMILVGGLIAIAAMFKLVGGDVMLKSLGVMAALVAMLAGVMLGLNKLAKVTDPVAIGMVNTNMHQFGITLLLMTASMSLLTKMDPDKYIIGLERLAGLMTMMTIVMSIMNASAKQGAAGGAKGALAFGVAIALMVIPLKTLAKMTDEKYRTGALRLLVIVGIMTGAIAAMNLTAKKGSESAKATLGMALTIVAITIALKVIGNMDWPSIWKGIVGLGAVMLAAAGAIWIASKNDAKGNMAKAFVALIVSTAAGLVALTFIDFTQILQAAGAMAGVMLAAAGAIWIASKNKTSREVAESFVAIIAMTAGGLFVLSGVPWPQLLLAATAMAGVMLAAAGAIYIASKSKNSRQAVVGFIAVLGLSVAGLLVLSDTPWKQLLGEAVAMGLVIGECIVALWALDHLKINPANTLKNAAMLGVVALEMVVIGIAMNKIDDKGILQKAIAIGVLAVALSASMILLEIAGLDAAAAIVGVLSVAGFAVVLVAMMTEFNKIDVTDLLPRAIIIGTLAIQLGEAMILFEIAGLAGPAAIIGIGSAAAFITAVIGLGAVLNEFQGAKAAMDTGLQALVEIGSAIGTAIGKFIANLAIEVFSALPQIGKYLGDFMDNLNPFFAKIQKLSDGDMEKSKLFADVMKTLAAANLENAVASVIGIFSGTTDFKKFGDGLVDMADGITSFAKKTASVDIDTKKTQPAIDLLKQLAAAADEIPNSGGLLGKLVGENDMGDWAGQMSDVAQGLVDFNNKFDGVSLHTKIIPKAIDIFKSLAKASDEVPNTGGLLAAIVGDNDMATWASEMPSVGEGIVGFSDAIAGASNFDPAQAMMAICVFKSIAEASKDLPPTGGLKGLLLGDQDATDFADQIGSIGKGIATFCKNAAKADLEAGEQAIKMLGDIIEFGLNSAGAGLAANLAGVAVKMGNIATAMGETFITNLKTSEGKMKNAIDTMETTLAGKLNTMASGKSSVSQAANAAGSAITEGVAKGYGDASYVGEATRNMKDFINKVYNATSEEGHSQFKVLGQYLTNGLAAGIGDSTEVAAVTKSAKEVIKAAMDAMRKTGDIHSPSRKTMKIGGYLIQGLANGIRNLSHLPVQAASDMVGDTIDTLRSALVEANDRVQDGLDALAPTITPVLDLSNVEDSAKNISGILDGAKVRADVVASNYSSRADQMMAAMSSANAGSNTYAPTIVNNFTINAAEGMSVNDISDKVSDALGFQYRQQMRAWQ